MEGASLANPALGPDPAAVRLDNFSHQRQAETGPFEFAAITAVHLVKPLENLLKHIGRYTDALVSDHYRKMIAFLA